MMTTTMIIKMIRMAPTAPPATGATELPTGTTTPELGGTRPLFGIKRKRRMKSEISIFSQENSII